jgi:hypothetical protein
VTAQTIHCWLFVGVSAQPISAGQRVFFLLVTLLLVYVPVNRIEVRADTYNLPDQTVLESTATASN